MGMALVKACPKPVVRKVSTGVWRVKWSSTLANAIWYNDFPTWEKAIKFAVTP